MNNLFNAFSIKIAGKDLDNKKFFEYPDYDVTSLTQPTDAETVTKAQAYIRLKHVERKLSELSVPVYFTIQFGTDGTAETVPTDAEISVAYISIEPFLSTLAEYPADADRFTAAAAVIKGIIDEALSVEIANEFFEVQVTNERAPYPGSAASNKYRQLDTEYLTVPASTSTSTVVYIPIKA